MTTADLVVVAVGIAAIAWVNWYFFVAGRSAGSATARGEAAAEEKGTETSGA